jgi:hypothetical protein
MKYHNTSASFLHNNLPNSFNKLLCDQTHASKKNGKPADRDFKEAIQIIGAADWFADQLIFRQESVPYDGVWIYDES